MSVNPFEILGIPAEAATHLDHNELQVLLALRKKIEDARHHKAQEAINALSDPATLAGWKRLIETDAPRLGEQDQQEDLPEPAERRDETLGVDSASPSTASHTDPPPGEEKDFARLLAAYQEMQAASRNRSVSGERCEADQDGSRHTAPQAESAGTPSSLVPVEAEVARYRLVVREVLRDSRVSTGVSLGWLARKASDLSLSRDELEQLLAARRDFGAGMPALMRAIANGVHVTDLYHLYRVRDEAASVFDGPTFSIKWISAFCDTFPEAQPDDDGLAEFLIDVHNEVKARLPWMWKYPDDALQMLIQIAKSYGVNNVDSCLVRLGPRRDEDDEADDEERDE